MYKYSNECLYIAGPECFSERGRAGLTAMRRTAEAYGFAVSLPNDKALDLTHQDLRENARTIYRNCDESLAVSTVIIADLEQFRGSEPDGGTVFELGMAYARGVRCYGYTRDMRDMVFKHPGTRLEAGVVYDGDGRVLPFQDLPFCPALVATTKLLEGNFDDALRVLMLDLDEDRKRLVPQAEPRKRIQPRPRNPGTRPLVYLSGPERYDAAGSEREARRLCEDAGFDVVSPLDRPAWGPRTGSTDPYRRAAEEFDWCSRQIEACDFLVANLNDFHGWEPNSDTAFECGYAVGLGKKCIGYMADTSNMRARIPHYGADRNWTDQCDNDVENFDFPINLMFSGSMPIVGGSVAEAIASLR